jgi:hypothetical protein
MFSEYERLRTSFKPTQCRLLLVGESRPAGGTFFYRGDSHLFERTREAFEAHYGSLSGEDAFLRFFKSLGCFVIDLCGEPVNNLSRKERRARHLAGEEPLGKALEALKPAAIVVVMKAIAGSVERAMASAQASGSVLILPFPSHGHDREYVSGLRQALVDLAKKNVLRK